MKAFAGYHGGGGLAGASGASIAGRFWACVWGMDCVLELRLDEAGRVQGSFEADGEPLEVALIGQGERGEVLGVIRARDLAEPFANFRARLDEDGLLLEVDVTDDAGPERAMFVRLGEE